MISDNPFSLGYKDRYGDPISDACGMGLHEKCIEDFTRCRCTVRGWHTAPHVNKGLEIEEESEGRG